ncbi:MAG: hypothetical protein ABSH48_10810 [Verrucomicrobiota bacterium]
MKTQMLTLIAVGAMIGVASTVQASFVFGYGGVTTINQTGDLILGNNFTVNSAIQVNELGVFSQDLPTAGSFSIGIYENNGSSGDWTLVGSIYNITSANETLDGPSQTDYIAINPLILGAGLYSIVTATGSDYNSGYDYPSPSAVTFDTLGGALSDGTYDIWSSGTSLGGTLSGMQANGPGVPNYPWATPVFGAGTFSATPVPEPATLLVGVLLLIPLCGSTAELFGIVRHSHDIVGSDTSRK